MLFRSTNFILAIETSAGNMNNMLNMVRNYIGEVISLITICSLIFAMDPVCLLIIAATVVIFTPLSRKISDLQIERTNLLPHWIRRSQRRFCGC